MAASEWVLNAGQRNRLTVEVRGLAAMCAEVEQLLQPQAARPLVEHHDDLTAEERALILDTVAFLKQQVTELAAQAGLTPQVVNVRRHLVALLSVEWSDLVDTRPAALRRYGAVDAQTAAQLQPAIEAMIERVSALLGQLQATR